MCPVRYLWANSLSKRTGIFFRANREFESGNRKHSNMSTIFRTKEWMTVTQLVRAWARELAAPEYGDPQHFERDLLHTLMEDAVNGRLDNSGPFREGQRSGLMIITPENKAGFIEGHQLRDLVPVG